MEQIKGRFRLTLPAAVAATTIALTGATGASGASQGLPAQSDADGESSLPQPVTTEQEMVVTANPIASEAGAQVLAEGGTAVDAMVTVQTVLGLVEPQSSGLGGGAFAVYYDAESGELTTYDGRETAPAAATGDRFLDADGVALDFTTAWQSGLSVGVPGVPRLLDVLHEEHGTQGWAGLFDPAVNLAQNGYEITGRTNEQVTDLLRQDGAGIFRDDAASDLLLNDLGRAKEPGTTVTNQAYADTLTALKDGRSDAFYSGPIAENIVNAVASDEAIAGDLTMEDLAGYEVTEREPVCVDYRGHEVCGMGPPSSGGVAVGQILGILGSFELESGLPMGIRTAHLLSQASRLAFADRAQYIGDSDFVSVPVEGLLDPEYLAERASLIDPTMDMGTATAGLPTGIDTVQGADATINEQGTSHFSIVDRYGNALSMTTTVESSFGNGVLVDGFFLNNQLTDFSFFPTDADGATVANAVEGGKRPRSSMSPTIVLDEGGSPEILTGSPGGSRIIGFTAQSLINMIDFDLDPQAAINIPHIVNRNGETELEREIVGVTGPRDASVLWTQLFERGYEGTSIGPLTSGLSIIEVTDDGLVGGADQRRDGAVSGN